MDLGSTMQKFDAEQVNSLLEELGLTPHERSLYLTSLELGPLPVTRLAEHLGITRPNIYKVISTLEKKGLAQFSDGKRDRKTFMVESPETVLTLLQKKQKRLEQFETSFAQNLPNLLGLYRQGNLPSSVRVYHRPKMYSKIFYEMLEISEKEVLFFGSADTFTASFSQTDATHWFNERMRKKIWLRTLVFPNQKVNLSDNNAKEFREIKVAKELPYFKSSFTVFANKVVFWQPEAKLAILLEDEYISHMMRAIFKHFWNAK